MLQCYPSADQNTTSIQPRPGPDPAGNVATVDDILTTERLVLRPVTADDHAVLR